MKTSVLNPRKKGYLIFGFNLLRDIAFSELLKDHNKICKDYTLDFYLDKLGSFIFTKDLSLHKARRVQKIASHYMKYEVLFSEAEIEEILSELTATSYDYLLIAKTDDLIRGYQQILYTFHRIAKNGTYIKTRDISKILKNYKTRFKAYETGSLRAA